MASAGLVTPRVSYIIAELEDLDDVFVPIKSASRVKYTCFDISKHYIVFGTTAGGVVILQHDNLNYLKTLTAKEGPVCQVCLAPDENIVGFATSRGVTIVMEHNAERGAAQPQRLQLSYEHRGSLVTCMQWNVSSSKLFVGDDKGRVSVISVTTSRTRNIFQVPTTTLMKLDSKVVQLDFAQDHLLVSTITKCYLCDTNKEQFMTIGKKLRDGEYGACFYPGLRSVDPCTIFSARPGSRMWEVDIRGNVNCTHQFKTALATKPEKLYSFRHEVNMDEAIKEFKPQATMFQKLLLVWPSSEDYPFIFTWSQHGAYVFDLRKAEVVMWSDDLKGIRDASCKRGDIYVFYADGRFVKYTLMIVEQGVCRLYQQGLALHGAQLLLLKKSSLCSSRLNLYVPGSFLIDMLQKASEMGKSYLFSGLSSIFSSLGLSPDKLSQSSRSSSAMSEPVRMNSGIYAVNKFAREADDEAQSAVCLSRWRSASPVFRHNSRSPHSSPSRSSDRTTYSPKSQRSTIVSGNATVRDSAKVRAAYAIRTPDSTDSNTSGKVSELSDEAQSSTSSKDVPTKENWQSWTGLQNSQSSNGHPASPEKSLSCDNSLITDSQLSEDPKSSSPKLLANGTCHKNEDALNESSPRISLNLQDLSKEGNSTEKRVSFKPTSSEIISTQKNLKSELSNGSVNGIGSKASEYSPKYEYPERFYDDAYSYSGMALYGSMMMMPNLDMSLLFGSDADLQNIKESLSNKFTSGKNVLMRNLRSLEQRMKKDTNSDLLDVKTKLNEPTSPVSHSEVESDKSLSDFHSADRHFWSFLPPIDVSELIEASKSTWTLTRDPNILLDKSKLHDILDKWVNFLHTAQNNVIQDVIHFLQAYHNISSQSYKDDDTLRSTCSQITSQDSSPSENCEISDKLEQEDPSICDSKTDEDKHLDSTHSFNVEISESSTLRTESVFGKLVNLENFVFVYDPFRLTYEDYQVVSDLTTMCFQLEIFGNVQKLVELHSAISKLKEESEKSAQKNLDKKSAISEIKGASFTNGFTDSLIVTSSLKHSKSAHSFPKPEQNTMQSNKEHMYEKRPLCTQFSDPSSCVVPNGDISAAEENTSDLDMDCDSQLAFFLQNYFHLFDVQRLRELFIIRNSPCMKVWSVLLKGASMLTGSDEFIKKLATEPIESASSCLERNFTGATLISHLLKVFKVSVSRAVELCLQRSYHVTPLDVLYLSKSCDSHPKPFLTYITCVLDCLPEIQRSQVLDKMLHLEEVRMEWISAVLQVDDENRTSLLKCTCGWPRPGSHLFQWKNCELLLHVIYSSSDLDEKLFALCFNSGFWLGYLQLLNKLKLSDKFMKTLIQLSDIDLVTKYANADSLISEVEEWRKLYLLFSEACSKEDIVICFGCKANHSKNTDFVDNTDSACCFKSNLNWESISKVALSYLGPIKVLELLQGIDIPNGAFSSGFYKSVLMLSLMDKQQSALTHRMLSRVGSYLWSRKPQSLSPEIRYSFQKGKEKQTDIHNAECDKSNEDKQSSSKSSGYHLEEAESHWGIATSLNGICRVCKIPLLSHLSSSQDGITVYRCGHSFHTACANEGFCIVCLTSQKSSS